MKPTETDTKEITHVGDVAEVAEASPYPIDAIEEYTQTDVYENEFQKSTPSDKHNKKKKKKGLWARFISLFH